MSYYVPVLRWKAAEKGDLEELSDEERSMCRPLIELIPKNLESKSFAKLSKELKQSCQSNCLYLDFQTCFQQIGEEFPNDKADNIFGKLLLQESRLIPVVRLAATSGFLSIVKRYATASGDGICLRVTCEDLQKENADKKIALFLDRIGIDTYLVDLLVDSVFINTTSPDIKTPLLNVPNPLLWRNLIWIGGSFPRNLTELSVGNHYIPRSEWEAWRKLSDSTNAISRVPAFGDYTIQHPIFYAPPPHPVNVSASIRYTLSDSWLVMRGEGLMNKDGPKNKQYPAHATILCDSTDFSGAGFSAGDSYIAKTALDPSKPGNATTWLKAGINHHMTMVTTQLQAAVET